MTRYLNPQRRSWTTRGLTQSQAGLAVQYSTSLLLPWAAATQQSPPSGYQCKAIKKLWWSRVAYLDHIALDFMHQVSLMKDAPVWVHPWGATIRRSQIQAQRALLRLPAVQPVGKQDKQWGTELTNHWLVIERELNQAKDLQPGRGHPNGILNQDTQNFINVQTSCKLAWEFLGPFPIKHYIGPPLWN